MLSASDLLCPSCTASSAASEHNRNTNNGVVISEAWEQHNVNVEGHSGQQKNLLIGDWTTAMHDLVTSASEWESVWI